MSDTQHTIDPISLSSSLKNKKIAIVHDFLLYPGGAERVLRSLADLFPDAPIYTLLYDKEKMRGIFDNCEVQTSYLQKFPSFWRKRYRWLLPFMPSAPEAFDLREFDLVISTSSAWSKAIVTKLHTKHIAYIHSPMRYVWDENIAYMKDAGEKNGFIVRSVLSYLRVWDYQAAQRPDVLIANSEYTQKRIEKYYRRKSKVIFPPITSDQLPITDSDANTGDKTPEKAFVNDQKQKGEYFLVVSRLTPYKNTALAVEVCNKLKLPLVVIGEGKEYEALQKIAGETVKIVGYRSDAEIDAYYKKTRAFLFPCEDDFGLTMVEALSHGVPVIALRRGGAKEIVEEGVTGEFFDAPVVEVFADALRRFIEKEDSYDAQVMMHSAQRFSQVQFQQAIIAQCEEIINSSQK